MPNHKFSLNDLTIPVLFILFVISIMIWPLLGFIIPLHYPVIGLTILSLMTMTPLFFLLNSQIKKGPHPVTSKLKQFIISGSLSASFTLLIALIAVIVGNSLKLYSQKQFDDQRQEFLNSSSGFNVLKDYALKNYKTVVELGDINDSWALTTINIPNASPASMQAASGYCILNLSPQNVLNTVPSSVDKTLWVQGIMMHEFAHCVDRARDLPNKHSLIPLSTLSIAPEQAKKVTDLQSYLQNERSDQTQLWREAVSDIFAVGYWKIKVDHVKYHSLVNSLYNYRAERSSDDPEHGTMCFINAAMNSKIPISEEKLFEWSDEIRRTAKCKIS
ncbi:hypothetical protein NQ656_17440 [Acinetobacter baumannii]|nr:hypothetical protein [Acinetobacter baumannii]